MRTLMIVSLGIVLAIGAALTIAIKNTTQALPKASKEMHALKKAR